MTEYALSAEEYILSLLLVDQSTAAVAIQEEAFPNASEEEVDARLDSGLSGLLSKKLLEMKDESYKLDQHFQEYLLRMSKVLRMVKFQVAEGESNKTVSLFPGEQMYIQIMEHNSRVNTFFSLNDLASFNNLVDFTDVEEKITFTIPEPKFDQFISRLLSGSEEFSPEFSNDVPQEFVNALVKNKGQLNSIFDFQFDNDGNVNSLESYLYLTEKNKTWSIKQKDNLLVVFVKPLNQVLKL